MASYAVILAAAGRSSRFRDKNYSKVFVPLDNRAVWLHSAEKFINRPDVKQLIVVISAEDRETFEMKFSANVAILGIEVIEGGAERIDSVQKALDRVRDNVDYVVVHDAARPCLSEIWIDKVFAAGAKHGAAILAHPVNGTLKRISRKGEIEETISRAGICEAQTPQVFRRELLVEAYAKRGGLAATDDAQLVEQLGHPVVAVPGSPLNIKITRKEDLKFAALALKALPKPHVMGPAHPFELE